MQQVPKADPAYLRPEEAAAYVGFSARSLRRWRSRRWIRVFGLRGRPRYLRQDLDALMEALATLDDHRG